MDIDQLKARGTAAWEWAKGLDFDALNRRYGHWLALASGIASVILLRRGATFAPVALAGLIAAWTLAAMMATWLPEIPEDSKWLKIGALVGATFVAGLYQDTLFFLIPLWWGSSTLTSLNVVFPILLAAMALFSCFEVLYREHVLEVPGRRAAWSAVVLFATLVPALPTITNLPLAEAVALAGAVAVLAATLVAVGHAAFGSVATILSLISSVAFVSALLYFTVRVLPPVPVQVVDEAIAIDVEQRVPQRADATLVAPINRVYAWFAITAPKNYAQHIEYHWFRDGEPYGKPFVTKITGGREAGWRTWAYVSNPRPGAYRVDLYTDDSQLIGRQRFDIHASETGPGADRVD